MNSALIGYTGFVGSNLASAHPFSKKFNSRNISEICGQTFDLIICAGVSAEKWRANENPEHDWSSIQRLIDVLETVSSREFILISSIDVYPQTVINADERTEFDAADNHAYGEHRYRLEQWAQSKFELTRIVRLPALFGRGLKKNALFDLLNDNQVEKLNPEAEFQWYPVARLWADLTIIRDNDLRLVNLFTEPLKLEQIIRELLHATTVPPSHESAPAYDHRTLYADLFGGVGGYVMSREQCLAAITEFIDQEGRKRDSC